MHTGTGTVRLCGLRFFIRFCFDKITAKLRAKKYQTMTHHFIMFKYITISEAALSTNG